VAGFSWKGVWRANQRHGLESTQSKELRMGFFVAAL
jgi:hypothetical protein